MFITDAFKLQLKPGFDFWVRTNHLLNSIYIQLSSWDSELSLKCVSAVSNIRRRILEATEFVFLAWKYVEENCFCSEQIDRLSVQWQFNRPGANGERKWPWGCYMLPSHAEWTVWALWWSHALRSQTGKLSRTDVNYLWCAPASSPSKPFVNRFFFL